MKELTLAQQKRLNERHAPLINVTFLLAIVIEGITTDIGLKRLTKIAAKLRAEIYAASPSHAELFGDWADQMEKEFFTQYDENVNPVKQYFEMQMERRQVLYVLCDKFYRMAKQMEASYRQIDPHFDFYQIKEATKLKKYADTKKLCPTTYKRINQLIDKIKRS